MRIPRQTSAVAGIVLIIAGAFLLFSPTAFTSRREVLQVGGLEVSAEERHPITPWIASAVLMGGVFLAFSGLRPKRISR